MNFSACKYITFFMYNSNDKTFGKCQQKENEEEEEEDGEEKMEGMLIINRRLMLGKRTSGAFNN